MLLNKKIPLSIALKITMTANNSVGMQEALQDAYESGELKGHQLLQAKSPRKKTNRGEKFKSCPALKSNQDFS